MAKNEYLKQKRRSYLSARSRKKKSQILDEICETTGYHRKHVLRALSKNSARSAGGRTKRGRPARYGAAELSVLKAIWKYGYYPCSERLVAMIPLWLPHYERRFGELGESVRLNVLSISSSSVDRLMHKTRLQHPGRGRSLTKPGSLLRNQIPIQTGQWEERRPGYLEADTVAHCGGNISGEFVYTLDCVDLATGWSEQRALWSKTASEVVKQMRSIEKNLPFELLGFDSDNGSEFINQTLVRHFLSRQKPVQFTRSRAYKKNDNAHIEQKNWTHVRQWLGYERIDKKEAVGELNALYTAEWRLYHNFYCASTKLKSKKREGSRIIKKYSRPQTPYQNIMNSEKISDYQKKKLKEIFENTDPFVLMDAIKKKLKHIGKNCYSKQT